VSAARFVVDTQLATTYELSSTGLHEKEVAWFSLSFERVSISVPVDHVNVLDRHPLQKKDAMQMEI
jgi:hypothetical protein